MEKKENLEIKMAPEELTAEDLEKVNGGVYCLTTYHQLDPPSCEKDDSKKK